MEKKEKIYIITNESVSEKDNFFFCDNIDLKTIPEELNKKNDITLFARKSKIERSKKIFLEKIYLHSNIVSFSFSILLSIFKKNCNYLIISLTPYTFIANFFLKLFFKKNFIYLRSDGYEEYKSIFGFYGSWIYHLMFQFASINSNLISCRERILKNKKGKIVHPSQINERWFQNRKKINFEKIKMLYVGRMRIEKGIFSLMELIKDKKLNLQIVTSEKYDELNLIPKNCSLINFENKNDSIIKFYDECNIFILPSFTEGHSQVVDEALARLRPVIIFSEISHLKEVGNRRGVFVCKREIQSLVNMINYISLNYNNIKTDMEKNILPTKKDFINDLSNILLKN